MHDFATRDQPIDPFLSKSWELSGVTVTSIRRHKRLQAKIRSVPSKRSLHWPIPCHMYGEPELHSSTLHISTLKGCFDHVGTRRSSIACRKHLERTGKLFLETVLATTLDDCTPYTKLFPEIHSHARGGVLTSKGGPSLLWPGDCL